MKNILNLAESLKEIMLLGTGSLVSNDQIWTEKNFNRLLLAFTKNPQEGGENFVDKLALQLSECDKKIDELNNLVLPDKVMLLQLSVELLSIYYAFPTNVSIKTKLETLYILIEKFYENLGLNNPGKEILFANFNKIEDAFNEKGIGSGGIGYNTNRQVEFSFLLHIFSEFFKLNNDQRKSIIGNNIAFQNWLDEKKGDRNPQSRHLLLYYFYPDIYEPIVTFSQKKKITNAFEILIKGKDYDQIEDPIDQKISDIKEALKNIRNKETNFYEADLQAMWNGKFTSSVDLEIKDLLYKKQIVLYGPPGTGKTYTAYELAKDVIRHELIKQHKNRIFEKDNQLHLNNCLKKNIYRLQLHPAYSYEEFIRGMQLVEGNTRYKDGFLLKLLKHIGKNIDPFVLILDEMNRVDLSRLFGECFSALEMRDTKIQLISSEIEDNENNYIEIPSNLYIIGTMNLIDHSVEQLDFALRRRFLWQLSDYDENALLNILEEKWSVYENERSNFLSWSEVFSEFEKLAKAASNLNKQIENLSELGNAYKLGHVFFVETLNFLISNIKFKPKKIMNSIFNDKNEPQDPASKLWKLSLKPLLTEYLSGLDEKEKNNILKKLEKSFQPGI